MFSVVGPEYGSAAFRACVENPSFRFVLLLVLVFLFDFAGDFEDEDDDENEEDCASGYFSHRLFRPQTS